MTSKKLVRRAAQGCGLVSIALAGAGACGGGQPPVTSPLTVASSASSIKAAATGVPGEDRTPVDAPKNLAVQMHASAPRAIIKAVKGYLPAAMGGKLDARTLVGELVDAPALAQLVDIDAPVDAAMAAPEGEDVPLFVYAFGIENDADVAAVVKADFRLDPVAGGAFKLIPLRSSKYDDPGLGRYYHDCAIVPAIGPSKRRLLCCPNLRKFRDIDYLAPWLARGVTNKPAPTSDLTFEMDAVTLRARYADDLKQAHDKIRGYAAGGFGLGKAQLDKVTGKLGQQIIDEAFDFAADVDAATMGVSFPADGARATLSVTFGHSDSWTAKAFLAGEGVDGAPPALFGKLPSGGAWLAEFARASSTSDSLLLPFQTGILQLVEAASIDFAWPQKDKDAALELVRMMFPRSADAVVLAGAPAASGDATAASDLYGPIGSMLGVMAHPSWTISATDHDAKGDVDLAKAIGALLMRPSFTSMLTALTDGRIALKVTSKAATSKDLPKGAFDQALDVTVSAADDVVEESSGKPKSKPKMKVVSHFATEQIVIPEGTTRSWVGWSQNGPDGDLLARMKIAMSGSAPAPLSASPGFDFLTKANASSGAIITIDGMVRMLAPKPKDATDVLGKLPDGGKGALAARTSSTRAGSGGTTEISLMLPRDLLVLGTQFFDHM